MNTVEVLVSRQPLSGFDLIAIGLVLVVVMGVFAVRWIARVVSGKPKYAFDPVEREFDHDPR